MHSGLAQRAFIPRECSQATLSHQPCIHRDARTVVKAGRIFFSLHNLGSVP